MLLNLSIICDELAPYDAHPIGSAPTELTLSGPRMLSHAQHIESNFVYIADSDSLARLVEHQQHQPSDISMLHLVFSGSEKELEEALGSCKDAEGMLGSNVTYAVLIDPGSALDAVCETLQASFERFSAWERDVLASIAQGCTLQQTFDLCVQVLYNPVALFDSSLALMLTAGDVPKNARGSIWGDVLALGYTPDERLSKPERRSDEQHWEQSREPYYFKPAAYPNETELIAILRNQSRAIGTLGSVDVKRPFTSGQASLYGTVRDMMEMAIEAKGQASVLSEGMAAVMQKVIQGQLIVPDASVGRALAERKWGIDDHYLVCYVASEGDTPLSDHMRERAARRLKQVIPRTFLVPYVNGMAIVFHSAEHLEPHLCASSLEMALADLDLICGVCMPMRGFMMLRHACEQAHIAARFGRAAGDARVCYFDECYAHEILGMLGAEHPLDVLCDPAILAMAQTGDAGVERVRTLLAYLVCNKNMSETARSLSVHRNTLVYRLERIENELGQSLDGLLPSQTLLLLLSCLIATDASD